MQVCPKCQIFSPYGNCQSCGADLSKVADDGGYRRGLIELATSPLGLRLISLTLAILAFVIWLWLRERWSDSSSAEGGADAVAKVQR